MKLTPHFDTGHPDKCACRCGCGAGEKIEHYDPGILYLIEEVRMVIDRPLKVGSMARCPNRNEDEKGSERSAHRCDPDFDLYCSACDIKATLGYEKLDIIIASVINAAHPCLSIAAKRELFMQAKKLLRGIGIGKTFVHIDCNRRRSSVWTYD